MRSFLLLLIAACFALPAAAETKFLFKTENWRGEQILLPPGFAPTMKWKGIEDIRFAPGMFDADSESFFSYALVFLLDEDADISTEGVHEQVLMYYQGLSTAVLKGKGQTTDVSKFELKLGEPETADDVTNIDGTLDWVEPFATQNQQKLNLQIRIWKHGDKPALFFIVSPQGKDHAIWTELEEIRDTFKIEG
ncbi:MAG: hypothetical protein AAF585_29205 [Verrucomicrobiota bacterium]